MKNIIFNIFKKCSAALMAVLMVMVTLPVPSASAQTLNVSFDISGASNFPNGSNIPFTINTNTPTQSTNTLNDTNFPDGTYTLTATLPPDTEFVAGNDYVVNATNVVQFTKNPGVDLTLVINLGNTAPPAPTTGNLELDFDGSGASNFQNGTNVPFTINTPNQTQSTNTLNDSNFPAGTFTVSATLPQNTELAAGNGYTVTGTNTAEFTMIAGGMLDITIMIADAAGAGGGTSTITVGFDATTSNNFQNGTSVPFTINSNPQVSSTNTYSDTNFPVGTFILTSTLPANTQVGPGNNYTVTGTNTVEFTTTNGGTVNLSINIVDGAGGGGGNGSSTVNISFDSSTSNNFQGGTNVPFTINTNPQIQSTNTYADASFPVGTFTLTATLPQGTQLGAGNNYTVTGTNTAQFTTTNGGNLNLSFNIVDGAGGGGGNGTSTVNIGFDASTSTNFPNNTNVAFTINTNPQIQSTNTYADASFPVGTFTLTANLPANTEIGAGNNYTVTGANTISFTTTNGGTTNLNISVVDAGAGGGGGGRRQGEPSITFLRNGQPINALTIVRGENANLTVTSSDGRGGVINLSLQTNPTQNSDAVATFDVQNQSTTLPTGNLSWVPGTYDVGAFNFTFSAQGRTTTVESFVITVLSGPTGGGGGNSGGGSGGNSETENGNGGNGGSIGVPSIEDRVEACEYSDNKTESVIYLCLLGIIDPPNDELDYNGNSKNRRYFGRQNITRAAFTKIMVNVTYEPSTIERVAALIDKNDFFAFPDVEPIAWFARFITVAKLDDHVHGYPDLGLYIPWNNIEISEAAKILFNTARHDNQKIKDDLEQASKDVGESPWFMKFAALTYKYGGFTPDLTKEDPGIIYSQQLNRQQAADMIYTTIQNAGIETKSHVSAYKEDLMKVQKEIEEAQLDLDLDPVPAI